MDFAEYTISKSDTGFKLEIYPLSHLNIAPIVECINDLYQIRSRKDGRKWVYDILPVGYYMSFEKNEENSFKALFRVEIVK